MLTPQEVLDIRRWHPDEIKKHAADTLTFMWSPTAGLFVGWPLDHDPTRDPVRVMPPGTLFRPNHAEVMKMDPDFNQKFFKDRPDLLKRIAVEPNKARLLLDEHGLTGRVGRGIKIAGRPRTVCGFWESPNFDTYLRRCLVECRGQLGLQPDDIIYPWQGEPQTLQDVLGDH